MAGQFPATVATCLSARAAARARAGQQAGPACAITRAVATILMVWFKRFPNPILLPNGRRLHSLQDASDHIALLPQAERDQSD